MEKCFDQLLEDVRAGQERLRHRIRDLWRETSTAIGGDPLKRMVMGPPSISEKLWTRMQLEQGRCQDRCGGPSGEVARQLGEIAANALLYRDAPCQGFDLDGMKITVFVVRCFNAAMALTQCRLCAAALVWELVNVEIRNDLDATPAYEFQSE